MSLFHESERAGDPSADRAVFYDTFRGFTLVELLTVLAIISILGALTLPSLTGLSPAGRFDSAVSGVSETLTLARETAVARDTYVWVAFSIPAVTSDPPLSTLVVASADGTNPFSTSWSTTVSLPNSSFFVVSKPAGYAQCQFLEAGAITPTQIPSLPSMGAAPNAGTGSVGNGLGSGLTFTYPSSSGLRTYSRVIEYSPSGLVYNSPNPVSFVEFGLEPSPVPTATLKQNLALLRVPFVTGRTQLYRP